MGFHDCQSLPEQGDTRIRPDRSQRERAQIIQALSNLRSISPPEALPQLQSLIVQRSGVLASPG